MKLTRKVIVFDAADLEAESSFWAEILGAVVFAEDDWHSIVTPDGDWLMGIQMAPNHVPPEWPDGAQQQQVHLDLHAEDPAAAHEEVMSLGARLLQPAEDLNADEGHQVYADPAGHPFCIGWGHPSREAIANFVKKNLAEG